MAYKEQSEHEVISAFLGLLSSATSRDGTSTKGALMYPNHSEDDSNSFETPTPTRRGKKICSGIPEPLPLMEGRGKSLKVLGFSQNQRADFLQILMRFGVGDYDWKQFAPRIKHKSYEEITEYGKLLLSHIVEDITDSPTFTEGVTYPNMIPVASEIDNQPHVSASLAEPPVASDYGLEEEAREYVNSVHIDDDPVDKYSLPEHQQQLHEDLETEIVVEETSAQEASPPIHNVVHTVQETPAALVEESFEEPPKKTYASILRVAKGQPVLSAAPQHVPQYTFKSAPPPSELNHVAQPAIQQSSPVSVYVPESGSEPADEGYGLEDEGEVTSVYVRNLPANVTEAEIDQEFKNFGRIKPDGIFIRVRKEIGVCYAFVEFEDIIGVQNALQASPIQLAGRQVYIEERRPNSGSAVRGGRRGRGRGSYQADAPRGRFGARNMGRGSNLDNSDYSRLRGDGYLQRSSR